MIMALIYRNVPRKKTNELLLLGEQIAAEAERIGIVNRVVAADEFDAAVAEWAEKLAAKSPVMMRWARTRCSASRTWPSTTRSTTCARS